MWKKWRAIFGSRFFHLTWIWIRMYMNHRRKLKQVRNKKYWIEFLVHWLNWIVLPSYISYHIISYTHKLIHHSINVQNVLHLESYNIARYDDMLHELARWCDTADFSISSAPLEIALHHTQLVFDIALSFFILVFSINTHVNFP